MIKKLTALLLSLIFILGMTAGCTPDSGKNGKLNIVCSIFPQYDFTRQILGDSADDVNLTLLVNNGTDLHSYQPSVKDISSISTCDMFIYVGGNSDKWVDDVLGQAINKNMTVINLLDVLGEKVKEEELIEGMEEEHEEEEGGTEYDEHVWLSVKNASVICEEICEKLCSLVPKNAEAYRKNADEYIKRLGELDAEYKNAVNSAKRNTLIFGDRFPFRYLADDYNIEYYAAFPGCSAETEASFETIIYLANKVDEKDIPAILIIDGSSSSIAETVRKNTSGKNQKILSVNSLQSVTNDDISNGVTYLSVMTENLKVFKEALN